MTGKQSTVKEPNHRAGGEIEIMATDDRLAIDYGPLIRKPRIALITAIVHNRRKDE